MWVLNDHHKKIPAAILKRSLSLKGWLEFNKEIIVKTPKFSNLSFLYAFNFDSDV